MANISISLEGIDQAISNLKYKGGSIKHKAVMAIRSFYVSEESIKKLNSIDMDLLIQSIWDVGDDLSKIKAKRRNFSSIKSSINADLEDLSKKALNPESIMISDSNIFDMTEEAKSNLLSSFTDAVKTGDFDLGQATDLLNAVADFLDHIPMEKKGPSSQDIVSQIKKILSKITEDFLSEEDPEAAPGLNGHQAGDFDKGEGEGEGEGIKADIEEIEEIEADEDIEEIELDEEIEEIELDEDQEIEEVEEEEDPIEDAEEILLDEDETLEEVEEIEENIEETALEESIEEIDIEEDVEEIELDKDEEIEVLDQEEQIEEIHEIGLPLNMTSLLT